MISAQRNHFSSIAGSLVRSLWPTFPPKCARSWFLEVGNCLIKAVKKANVNKWKSSVLEVAAVLLHFLEIPSDYIKERGKTFQWAQLHYLPIAGDINTPPQSLCITWTHKTNQVIITHTSLWCCAYSNYFEISTFCVHRHSLWLINKINRTAWEFKSAFKD